MDPAEIQKFLDLLNQIGTGQVADLTKQQLKQLAEAFSTLSGEQLSAVEATGLLRDAQLAAAGDRKAALKLAERAAKALKEEAEATLEAAKAKKDKIKVLKAENQAIEANIDALKAQRNAATDPDEIKNLTKAIAQQNQELEDNTERLDKLTKQQSALESSLNSVAKSFGEMGKASLAGKDAGNKFAGSIGGIADSSIQALSSMGKFSAGMAGVLGVGLELAKAVISLAADLANASNALQKASGVSVGFADSIMSGYKETRQFNGSIEELSATATELTKNFTDFTMMSGEAAKSLAITGTLMSKLGVSNADFARGIQLSTKAFGMSVEQAEDTQLRLAALAMDIGVAPSQMAADFAAAGPQLAKFGSDAERAFKNLAITAKSTGIEVGRLLQITEKFDTFEGAAEQAGKLNAALGGNFVNAMDMMTETDPAARFEMMTNAIKDAGLSFDDMSYYQRKFYADAMGLSDVSELALALSGNTAALGKEVGKTSADYEAMAERAASVQSLQEELNIVFADMVPILMDLVKGLRTVVGWMKENKEMVQLLTAGFLGLGIAINLGAAPLWALAAAAAAVGYVFFKQTWSSNFVEATEKLGNAFGYVGEMISSLIGDMSTLNNMSNKLGFGMLKGNNSLKVSSEMTTKSLEGLSDQTAETASITKAAAPIIATSGAVSSAINNYSSSTSTTTNNNTGGGATKVEIGLADGFKDMFSAKVINEVVTKGMGGLL